jgi:glycosyltransferase involved in cell wall biosynthesis
MGLISIVIPVVSRMNRLILHTKQLEALARETTGHDFEFIFVDDGSHSESLKVLSEKAATDKRYRVVTLTRDFGPTASFLAGITYASGDCAGFFSGRQLDPSQVFGELIKHWESGSKVVFGKWQDPEVKTGRSGSPMMDELPLMRRLFPNRVYFRDISSLLIDKEVIYILSEISDPYSDIIEIIAWTGFSPQLVEYSVDLQEGEAKCLMFKSHPISLDYSEGIYSPRSLRTSFTVGLGLTILGGVITAGLFIYQETNQVYVPEWLLLISVLVIIFGVQLGLMGLFGERLFRSLEKIRSRPVFVVESVINPPVETTPEGREKIEKMILSLWNIRKQKIAYSTTVSPLTPEDDVES